MRTVAIATLLAVATLGAANAFEGVEDQIMQAVGRTAFGDNCEPVRALMGKDPFFQGHYERCLGMAAQRKAIDAKNAGNTKAVQQHDRTRCEHYRRAIALWQQNPLPTHGSEKDVKRRRTMLEGLIEVHRAHCPKT